MVMDIINIFIFISSSSSSSIILHLPLSVIDV